MPIKSPSAGYSKGELQQLAEAGVRERLRDIERELARIQRTFPHLLVIDAPLVLVAPEPKPGGQPWPALEPPPRKSARRSAAQQKAWTPARRKRQAARMKQLSQRLRAAKRTKARRATTGGLRAWQRMHQALLQAPDHRATSKELQAAAHLTSVHVAQARHDHPDLFKRVAPGVYALTAAAKNGAADA